jgi:heat shock protein HslJ
MRDGHLFLSLMADGGIYELEPVASVSGQRSSGDVALEGTSWTLTELDGAPISRELQKEPHLIFDSGTGRVGGWSGCNHVSGSYRVEADSLELGGMIGTLMACQQGMETERAFLQALERVARWRISGSTLALLDGAGTAVARFEGSNP